MRDANASSVVVRDSKIGLVLALGDTILYGRGDRLLTGGAEPPTWWRLVNGRRLTAHLPARSYPVSIGRDGARRVVAVLARGPKSWIYDIANDSRRPLPKLGRKRCSVAPESVSMWRRRIAYIEQCRGGSRQAVVLREGGRARRVARIFFEANGSLFLRGRSLVAQGVFDESAFQLWRILDRGRRCPAIVDSIEPTSEWDRRAVSVSRSGVQWALSDYIGAATGDDPFHTTDLTVMGIDFSGKCEASPTQRLLALNPSSTPVRTYTLDGKYLLYADDTAIHRVRLPAKGSTAPPPNDDFERATLIPSDLDHFTKVIVGHATRQPGEPASPGARTVWYRFNASFTGRVYMRGPALTRVYTGSSLSDLVLRASGFMSFDIVAGQEYWVQVIGSSLYPSYEPTGLRLTAG